LALELDALSLEGVGADRRSGCRRERLPLAAALDLGRDEQARRKLAISGHNSVRTHRLVAGGAALPIQKQRLTTPRLAPWKVRCCAGRLNVGYFNGEQVLACEGSGVLPCIPKTVWPSERGLFTRNDFVYDAQGDHYTCPAGQTLTKGTARSDRKDDIDHYRHLSACFTCALKPQCTPDKLKRLKRWTHEGVMDQMQARLERMPDAMTIRRQTVEHPFGTLKSWMGSTHFLTKTLEKVRTEMSLHVLAYNLKRVIQILGVRPLMEAIRA
jgi:hypothetical protein